MRRREFIAGLGGAAATWSLTAYAQQFDRMPHVSALQKAKRDYEKVPHPSEAARSDYITRLIRMREKAARLKTDEWQPIDAEIKRHPAPPGSKSFSNLLVGKWQSPRRDYLFRADGTWTMLPAEEDGVQSSMDAGALKVTNFFRPPPRSHRKASTPSS